MVIKTKLRHNKNIWYLPESVVPQYATYIFTSSKLAVIYQSLQQLSTNKTEKNTKTSWNMFVSGLLQGKQLPSHEDHLGEATSPMPQAPRHLSPPAPDETQVNHFNPFHYGSLNSSEVCSWRNQYVPREHRQKKTEGCRNLLSQKDCIKHCIAAH